MYNAMLNNAWTIEGPRSTGVNEIHVYAYQNGAMIGMLDGQLSGRDFELRMAYVSPAWRGSRVMRDMFLALKRQYNWMQLHRRR